MPEPILEWGIAVVLWLQGQGGWLSTPMNALTFTGNTLFFLFVLPMVYWSIDRRFGIRVAMALMISIMANSLLKMAFHAPRPYWIDTRVRLLGNGEALFGLPSGHAQNAVVMWGMLAAQIARWWGWILCIGLMALVGLSRVYIGVHFPTDVLMGWLIGALILVLYLRYEEQVVTWFRHYSAWTQVGFLFAMSLAVIAAGALLAGGIRASWAMPAAWEENALAAGGIPLDGVSLQDTVTSIAATCGMAAGAVWLHAQGNFDAGGPIKHRVFRYVIGVLGVAVFYLGLDAIFAMLAEDESVLGLVLRYVRYGLVGFWMIGLGPMVFLRLGWAEVETERESP